MRLAELLLTLLLRHVPPGETYFSVELRPDCGTERTAPACALVPKCLDGKLICAPPRWSTFYGAWVESESAEAGRERYREIAEHLAAVTLDALCLYEHADGTLARYPHECEPIRWGYSYQRKRNLGSARLLALSTLAALIAESGAREDVEVGRGRHRSPVDGGEGRGPANEACLLQIHPAVAWAFADWAPEDVRRRAARGNRAARDSVADQLVGRDGAALERCLRTGVRMIAHAREWCERGEPSKQWAWKTFAYYGTGSSCAASNAGKTDYRVRLLDRLAHGLGPEPKPAPSRGITPPTKLRPATLPSGVDYAALKRLVTEGGAANRRWQGATPARPAELPSVADE